VPFAVDVLHMDAKAIGVTLALQGVGMVLGSLAAPRIMRRIPFGTAIVVGPLASTLASLTMALTLWWPSSLLAGLSFFLFGSGPVLWTISQITLRQTVTPDAMLGRVSALFMTASAGSRPLGAVIGGWIGATWSVEACLVASFAGFVLQALVVMVSPLPALERLRTERHVQSRPSSGGTAHGLHADEMIE
jgi:predicted MFS family arabinose efflux permease